MNTNTSNYGGNTIRHPSQSMTAEERSFEMWAVHPDDIKALGFKTRQDFFAAHLKAAEHQVSIEGVSQQRLDFIEAMTTGGSATERWERHTGVYTFEHLRQWAEQQHREILRMRARRDSGKGPPKDELEDYLVGKQAAFGPLLANIRQIAGQQDEYGNAHCPFCNDTVDPEGNLSHEEDPVTGDALSRGPECQGCGATAPTLAIWNNRA